MCSPCRLAAAFALFVLIGCHHGTGSDIGPAFAELPGSEVTAVLLDPDGQPVVGAQLTIGGARGASEGTGRAFVGETPGGAALVRIDATNATADGADRLHGFALQLDVPRGYASLAAPIVLPDVLAGDRVSVTPGALPSPVALASGGASSSLPSGTAITRSGASGAFELALTTVERHELPPVPLLLDPGTTLVTRGAWVLPVDVGFGPGVTLTLPNDLALPSAGTAQLWRFDGVAGRWGLVGSASLAGGVLAPDVAQLPGGGLYVFTTTVASSTTIVGRVVDYDEVPLPGALASSLGGHFVRAGPDGVFGLGPLPAVDASGAPLSLPLRISGPTTHEARILDWAVPAVPGSTDVGSIFLPARGVAQVRVLLAYRGRALEGRELPLGSAPDSVVRHRVTGEGGTTIAREIPYGQIGVRFGYVEGGTFVATDRRSTLGEGRYRDLTLFATPRDTREFGYYGAIQAYVIDRTTGAPIAQAYVQERLAGAGSDLYRTDELGYLSVDQDRGESPTAYRESASQGTTYRSAFSVAAYDQSSMEFPLELAPRPTSSIYGVHARLRGTITGAVGGAQERRALVRGRLRRDDWRRIALGGALQLEDYPRPVDPDVGAGLAFDLGIPVPEATVSIVEGPVAASVLQPERVGFASALRAELGQGIARDIALDRALDRALVLQGGLRQLHASMASADLRFELGLEYDETRVIALHGPHGGTSIQGEDVTVRVPELAGAAAYLGALTVSSTSGGITREQRQLVRAGTLAHAAPGFLPVPVITAPAHASTTASATDIEVSWEAMSEVRWFELEIRSSAGSEQHSWRVLLPGDRTSFRFAGLRTELAALLPPGRTWTLRLTATAVAPGSIFDRSDGYARLQGWTQSIGLGARGEERTSTIVQSFSTP